MTGQTEANHLTHGKSYRKEHFASSILSSADFGFEPDIANSALAFVRDWQHDFRCDLV